MLWDSWRFRGVARLGLAQQKEQQKLFEPSSWRKRFKKTTKRDLSSAPQCKCPDESWVNLEVYPSPPPPSPIPPPLTPLWATMNGICIQLTHFSGRRSWTLFRKCLESWVFAHCWEHSTSLWWSPGVWGRPPGCSFCSQSLNSWWQMLSRSLWTVDWIADDGRIRSAWGDEATNRNDWLECWDKNNVRMRKGYWFLGVKKG